MKTDKKEGTTPEQPTENVETAVIYTDRHDKPIAAEGRVNCRIGASWFPGSIVKFKIVDDEQYVHVLLDGREVTKMFHSTDVDAIEDTTTSKREKLDALLKKSTEVPAVPTAPVKKAPVKKVKAVVPPIVETPELKEAIADFKALKEEDIADDKKDAFNAIKPAVDALIADIEATAEVPDPQDEERVIDPEPIEEDLTDTVIDKTSNKAFAPAGPKSKKGDGVPKVGSKTEKIVELLKAGKTKMEVAKLTDSVYQFVHGIEKRYIKS